MKLLHVVFFIYFDNILFRKVESIRTFISYVQECFIDDTPFNGLFSFYLCYFIDEKHI